MSINTTFQDNGKLPVHRWFRFTAGFSAQWAQSIIREFQTKNKELHVLDPFAGSGTTLLAADSAGVQSWGFEAQPFIHDVALTKLQWNTSTEQFRDLASLILNRAKFGVSAPIEDEPALLQKCYAQEQLVDLVRLRTALFDKRNDLPAWQLCWGAFVFIVREVASVCTATSQYVLPNKARTPQKLVFDAFIEKVTTMCADMRHFQECNARAEAQLIHHDARTPSPLPKQSIDLVLTSPPYTNNYDYGDATRLEMTALGEISSYRELQGIRAELVRSCSQMVGKERVHTFEHIEHPLLTPIRDELVQVCRLLEEERGNHGGKKNYHTMVALYFLDLANVWAHLRELCADGATVCFAIGDSAPYGVYVPVDDWLGRLAIGAGFKTFSFENVRERNTKWKNRKHRVPLKEGLLWVQG